MDNSSFDFNKIENFVLAPGDIYWLKSSGEELLISKKSEVLNVVLCQKLKKHNHTLRIANEVNIDLILKIEDKFTSSRKEVSMAKKNIYRKKVIEYLKKEYVEIDRGQYELDMMVWRIFSKFTTLEQNDLVNQDIDLFKRSLRVTSSLVLSAFLLGYYDELFLEEIFAKTIKILMKNGQDEESKFYMNPDLLKSELSTWEKLFVTYNLHFPLNEGVNQANILHKLYKGKVTNVPRELKAVLKALNVNKQNSEDGVAA